MKILVVGATGQLGYTLVDKLKDGPHQVFAMHRRSSHIAPLQQWPQVELRQADLTQPETLIKAVKGMDAVICTANSACPTQKEDDIQKTDIDGVISLIRASEEAGIKQFIYTSAIYFGDADDKIPISRAKRIIEKTLASSSLDYTILRPGTFMEVYLPYLGTDLPLKGSQVSTVYRPFKFSNNFFKGIQHDIAEKGRINIIGKGLAKASYISVQDVAEFHIKALGRKSAFRKTYTIGGPEPLSALDLKGIFEELYGKPLKIKSSPPILIKLIAKVMSFSNPAASNIMYLNYYSAMADHVVPHALETAESFGVKLTSVKEFLEEKKVA
ncbi:SDR family oxidoreductase [Pararhodonellum marinum]|uniref:SDR family oxidoreductase n=1 Tax=Pararhodonellum marinum TaxID=2755358 RepID=UPI00188EC7FB|nr:SDR family oxidoreductase [Pararhodonellum marinum]